jgi:integrase
MIDSYLEYARAVHSPATVEGYEQRLRAFEAFLTKRNAKPGGRKIVNDFLLSLAGRGRATIYLHQVAIQAFYSWLAANEVIESNPLQHNPNAVTYVPSRRKPVFTNAEYSALKEASRRSMRHSYWTGAIIVGWNTGLRLADVAQLEWGEILFTDSSIRLKPQKTEKLEKVVEIPMAAELKLWLTDQAAVTAGDRYVQPAMAQKYRYDRSKTLSVEFGRVCKSAGIIGKSFHCFRHTFVSRNLAANVNPSILADMTGHTLNVIQRYSHPTMEEKREQMRGLLE